MLWKDDSGVWWVDQAAVRQRVLLLVEEENVDCPQARAQKSQRRLVRAGPDSGRNAAARKRQRNAVEELRQLVVAGFRN